ncbi:MAG: DNA methyltransferase [Rhodoplanes sp.]
MHPTVKPVALVADAMRDCSRRDSVILDAFAGSGTTIMAAEQIGRRAHCIEIEPAYADVAIRRWQRFTGRDAILEITDRRSTSLRLNAPALWRAQPAPAKQGDARRRQPGDAQKTIGSTGEMILSESWSVCPN